MIIKKELKEIIYIDVDDVQFIDYSFKLTEKHMEGIAEKLECEIIDHIVNKNQKFGETLVMIDGVAMWVNWKLTYQFEK